VVEDANNLTTEVEILELATNLIKNRLEKSLNWYLKI